jgi:hypothetical protein
MTEDMLSDIESLFKDYEVPARGRGRRFPDPVKSHILKLIQNGVSLSTINRATGISLVTLNSWRGKESEPHFQRIVVADQSTTAQPSYRLYISEKAWLELDETAIESGILAKIRSSL